MFRILFLMFLALPLSAGSLEVKVLTELDSFEPFEGMAFHANHLWVGRSRKDLSSFYQLEVFDAYGKEVAKYPLQHAAKYIYPQGPDSILIIGMSYQTQLSHYTIASLKKGLVKFNIPMQALGDRWAGNPNVNYFTDPGGLDDGSPMNVPLKTIFTLTSGNQVRFLAPRIRNPQEMILEGDFLYVVEHMSLASGGKKLHRIQLKTESSTPVLEGEKLTQLLRYPQLQSLLLLDQRAKKISVVQSSSGKVTQTIVLNTENARGLAAFGQCLALGDEQKKEISFYSFKAQAWLGERWDLSTAGNKFFALRNLVADEAGGNLFARSAYPAMVGGPVAKERNSVVMASYKEGEVVKHCLKAL